MKIKKVVALVMSVALLNCGFSVTGTDYLSQTDIVSAEPLWTYVRTYSLEATLEDTTIMVPEGTKLNNACLTNNGIKIIQTLGIYNDDPASPDYGKITKGDMTQELDLDKCTVEFPAEVKEGENKVKITYTENNTVSTELTVNVKYCDPEDSEANAPSEKEKYISMGMSSPVVKPGEETYVDINIRDNSGFCAFMVALDYDHDVFKLESLSAMPEFVKDYSFVYKMENDHMILMSEPVIDSLSENVGAIRAKFSVKADAPDGEYKIGIKDTPEDYQVATRVGDEVYMVTNRTAVPGTITVSKTLDPDTKLSPMSLGRVYAKSGDEEMIDGKTGDLNHDGNINAEDVSEFSDYLMGSDEQVKNADTTEDGKTNIADYVNIKSYVTQE